MGHNQQFLRGIREIEFRYGFYHTCVNMNPKSHDKLTEPGVVLNYSHICKRYNSIYKL